MALSAIYRTGQSFGAAHIIDVLRGSRSERIMERNHDQIKTFGAGSGYSKTYLQGFIRQLIAAGHATLNIKKFGGLEISKSGFMLLKGEIEFQFKQPLEPATKSKSSHSLKNSIPAHIYTHSKRDGGCHDSVGLRHEPVLVFAPGFTVQSGMIGNSVVALGAKEFGGFFCLFP